MYNKNDPETIQALFNSIAKNYDRTNALLSFNFHKLWNAALIDSVKGQQPKSILDLCCGTGVIAFGLLQRSPAPQTAYLLDFSEEMLGLAKIRAGQLKLEHHQMHFMQADAQAIPLPNSTVDCATIAYGIRNVQSPQKCMADVFRVLRPQGLFGILELTQPKNPVLRLGHSLYLRTLLPLMGKWLTSNQQAYQYLCTSIKNFIPPMQLVEMMKAVGFQEIRERPLFGGIATLLIARKPFLR